MGTARKFDFLRLDVEGAETDVLHSLDLSRWSFRCMPIEHADVPGICESFDEILLPHGYRRVLEQVSAFDAFYVLDKEHEYLMSSQTSIWSSGRWLTGQSFVGTTQ